MPDPYFSTRLRPDPRRRAVWEVVVRHLEAWGPIRPPDRVLELGAGWCDFINQVRARERHALDADEAVRARAGPGVAVHVGTCDRLDDFQDGSVDVVFASNLLEHLALERVQATLAESLRVLASGGRLIVLQPNFRYCGASFYDDYTHRTPLTHESLRDLLEGAGFASSRVVPRFLPFSFRSALPARAWLVRLYLSSPWKPWAGQLLACGAKG